MSIQVEYGGQLHQFPQDWDQEKISKALQGWREQQSTQVQTGAITQPGQPLPPEVDHKQEAIERQAEFALGVHPATEEQKGEFDKLVPAQYTSEHVNDPASASKLRQKSSAESMAEQMMEEFAVTEGTEQHEDSEGILTEAFGIVPDKGTEGTENPTKYGIPRQDYETQEDWTEAVLEEHYTKVSKKVEGFEDMDPMMQRLVMDTTWNAGVKALDKWPAFGKHVRDGNTEAAAFAVLDTANAGGKPNKGLGKRRAVAYNMATKGPKIAKVRQKPDGEILYFLEDGQLLFAFGKGKGRARGSAAGTLMVMSP